MWAIWYARRTAIHESLFRSPLSTRCFIANYLNDLKLIPAGDVFKPVRRAAAGPPKWIPLPTGCIKFNVDAALSKTGRKAAASAVARDVEWNYLGASSIVVHGITDPEVMESIAVREALALADDLLIRRARVASDCLRVINTLHDTSRPSYMQIIEENK